VWGQQQQIQVEVVGDGKSRMERKKKSRVGGRIKYPIDK
jgi:hypothetical protein